MMIKSLSRAIIFSAVALVLTALWNQGFKVNFELTIFIRSVMLVALFYYLLTPLTKIILIPINWLTLGLLSTIVYFLLFYFVFTRFPYIKITEWKFPGFEYNGLGVAPLQISYLFNIVVSSFSLSFIIRILELLL